ncbi:MAG TPA: hypothetical protein VGA70_08100 [Longimicrobiales bacterium]
MDHSLVRDAPMHTTRTAAFVAFLAALAACSSDPLGPHFEQELTRRGGCADVVFFAVDADDERMLSFRADGLVAEARAAGEQVVTTFDLSQNAATLIVERGTRIADAMCDDVIENGGPRVRRTWVAVAGRAIVTVRPGPSEFAARADLRLEDIVLDDGDGDRVIVEEMDWVDVSVGWFPG